MDFETQVLELESEIAGILQACPVADVLDQESYDGAAEYLRRLKSALNRISTAFKPETQRLHKAHKDCVEREKATGKPLADRFEKIDKARRDWKRAEETRIAAEQKRLEDEARLAQAQAVQDKGGDPEPILNGHAPVEVTPVERVRQARGISDKKLYSARITDMAAFVQFVAANPQWCYLLEASKALNEQARSQKELLRFPGVELIITESTSVRI